MWMRVVGAALILGWSSACTDSCDLVLGCAASRRVAVDGRVLETMNGHPTPGTIVRVVAQYAGSVDSAESTTDSRGLFSLAIAARGSDTPQILLRVIPPSHPGYLVPLESCKPVTGWGDACVIAPVVNEPSLPLLLLLDANANPVSQARVAFKRTGGAALMRRTGDVIISIDSVSSSTGAEGFANPFPLDVWAGSNEPVVGDLIIELPPPIGRVVRQNYAFAPSVFYGLRAVTTVYIE